MEVFVLYDNFSFILRNFGLNYVESHFWGLFIGFCVWLALFLLQGFGIWKMAQNRGMDKKGLAFVPFVNFLYMGKLAGDCYFFSQKVKKMGLFVMLAQIVATLFSLSLIAAISYLCVVEGVPSVDEYGIPYWSSSGVSGKIEQFYNIGAGFTFGISILSILQLIYEVLLLILTIGLFKKYAPKNYFLLAVLGIIFPMSRYIVTFCLRNKPAIDYEAYMRARREEIAREYQQRYGNQYGTNYGNPYGNPYGAPYGQQPMPPQKPAEPFDEFGKEPREDKPFEEFGDENVTEKPNDGDFFE